jgi:hypothetical protein
LSGIKGHGALDFDKDATNSLVYCAHEQSVLATGPSLS